MEEKFIITKIPDNINVGDKVKTHGEWDAKIVHITHDRSFCFAVHVPGTPNESIPIMHRFDGTPQEYIGIGIAPIFNSIHPATLKFE